MVLVGAFFLNWTWQAQLAWVAPFGVIWFAGWWRWQRSLHRFEVEDLHFRAREAQAAAERHAQALARGYPPDSPHSPEDWQFEVRYQQRRREEQAAEALSALAQHSLRRPRGRI